MHPALTIAQRAALDAGKVLLRHLDRLGGLTITAKQHNDFVSEVDVQSEQEIIRTLRKIFPHHGILAEESGHSAGLDEDDLWIIDPLDGTRNYLSGLPHFAVSIALQHKGRLEVGVVYDPIRQEVFTAARGEGAHLNDRRIRVRNLQGLEGALVGSGLPFKNRQHLEAYLEMFKSLYARGTEVRRSGSAALDLAYVASGRLDGHWALGLSAWDLAAGALLIQEAGGLVSDFGGGHDYMDTGNLVAGSPKVFKGIVQTIQPHLTPPLAR